MFDDQSEAGHEEALEVTIEGMLSWVDLEGGLWILTLTAPHNALGEVVEVTDVLADQQPGAVRVTGMIEPDTAFGIGMVGPRLRATRFEYV